MITDKTKIFRNTGTTKDKYPYIIKDSASGNFYAIRNLTYTWKFENQKPDKEDPEGGNATFTKTIPAYSPFFDEIGLTEAAPQFMKEWAKADGNNYELPEPKAHANRHTVTYDSGIMDGLSVTDSTVLQQVGMLMSYEIATLSSVSAVS